MTVSVNVTVKALEEDINTVTSVVDDEFAECGLNNDKLLEDIAERQLWVVWHWWYVVVAAVIASAGVFQFVFQLQLPSYFHILFRLF